MTDNCTSVHMEDGLQEATNDEVTSVQIDGKSSEKSNDNSSELKIGISEYLGSHAGFFGIIKQRYSDFIVNEVTSSGEIVHITDKTVPPIPDIIPDAPDKLPPELTPVVIEQLENLFGNPRPAHIPLVPLLKQTDTNAEISNVSSESEVLGKTLLKRKADPAEVLIDVNNVSKEGRTSIHQAVKAKYGGKISSSYKEEQDGQKYIVIRKANSGGSAPRRSSWPKSHMYTTFVLYKENIDTIDAINQLSRNSGVKANMFAYAGTKDKRGKTSQLVSVPRVPPRKLCHAASFRKCIHLGNFQFLPTPQKLGQLRGNRFGIVLREVKEGDDEISSAIESLKTNGFINYFGSQRFSTSSVSTHSIGRELLKSNWQEAVNLILEPRENESSALNDCRTTWKKTNDPEAALQILSDNVSSIEGKLLMGLKNLQKNDLVGALGMIPRNVRMLYLHAYQSYIWNIIVSRRIKQFGLKVLPGDIIRRKDATSPNDADFNEEDCEEDNKSHGAEENEKKSEENEKKALVLSNFHFLSAQEAESTPITEVFLPLPGHQVEYPRNEIQHWYTELLEADGLSTASLKHHVKCYSVSGMYRRLIVQPSDVTSRITYYSDPTKPLIQSDLDKMQSESVDGNLLREGPYKAVIIEMTLPSSTYATMALRELLKMDTSSAFQATLNENSGDKGLPSENFKPKSEKESCSREFARQDRSQRNYQRRGSKRFHSRGSKFNQGDSRGEMFGAGNSKSKGHKRPWRGSHHSRGGKRGKFN